MYTELEGLAGKRERRWAAVVGPALLAVGAVYAVPKLIAYFKGQGVSEEEASMMAQEVVTGQRPMPSNIDLQPEKKLGGINMDALKGFGIAALVGGAALMIMGKKGFKVSRR